MHNKNEPLVLLDLQEPVAIIKLNRSSKLNALNSKLIDELAKVLIECEKNPKINVALLHGGERSFAAGADIAEMSEKTFSHNYNHNFLSNYNQISNFSKPIIAAINGYALGGGLEVAMACDIIYASESAKLGQPEVGLGIIPGIGGTQRLVRAVGKSKAMEMCLSGKLISAKEALEFGLVAQIFPDQVLFDEALKTAHNIGKFSQPVLRMIKEAINSSFESPLSEGLKLERRLFYACFALEDQKEGMRAFLKKQPPNFKNG